MKKTIFARIRLTLIPGEAQKLRLATNLAFLASRPVKKQTAATRTRTFPAANIKANAMLINRVEIDD